MGHSVEFWIGFHLLIILLLILDWRFFSRGFQKNPVKKALILSGCWIGIALLFNGLIYFTMGSPAALQFFTGYLIEKALSVDNLFIFWIYFLHFKIPSYLQHKVLLWGILGAIFFRISVILAGIALIESFHWMFYVFGAFLIFSGAKFAWQRGAQVDLSESRFFSFLKKILPIANRNGSGDFFVKEEGRYKVTSLFLVLLMIECTDIFFALDSIPAVFAITTDPFLVYTSNVFAVLGLRALHMLLSSTLQKLPFYQYGLAAILVFIGAKMLLTHIFPISVLVSLSVVIAILGVTTIGSVYARKRI